MAEKMLIIDDDEIILKSCRKIFEAEGFEVSTTENPQEGLNLVSEKTFAVVLVDWMMPGFDGMDVVEEIDRRSPNSALVMISGHPSVGRATEAMKRGAMDYLPKPFKPEEITAVVKKAVRRKVAEESKAMGRFEKMLKTLQFPVPTLEDKAPKNIAETFAQSVGVAKATSPWFAVTVLGILAGAYIGFGGLFFTTVTFDAAAVLGTGVSKMLVGAAFSVGLMLVVIAGAELFTGNNLMVSSVMSREISFSTMMKGGAVTSPIRRSPRRRPLLLLGTLEWDGAAGVAVQIAYAKVNHQRSRHAAIGCTGCLLSMALSAPDHRQDLRHFFPIMAFVTMGFEHCIANMYFITGILLTFRPDPPRSRDRPQPAQLGLLPLEEPAAGHDGNISEEFSSA